MLMKRKEFTEPFSAALDRLIRIHGANNDDVGKDAGYKDGKMVDHMRHERSLGTEPKRRAIAKHFGYGYDEFLDIGEQIIAGTFNAAGITLPRPTITSTATVTPPTQPNVTNISNKHQGVIEKFRDKERGLAINQDLVELESLDEDGLEEIHDIIKLKLKNLRKKTEKKTGTDDLPT